MQTELLAGDRLRPDLVRRCRISPRVPVIGDGSVPPVLHSRHRAMHDRLPGGNVLRAGTTSRLRTIVMRSFPREKLSCELAFHNVGFFGDSLPA